ncbi:hypothetical protein ACBJ59_54610 [Nonomuraea sp. MTCD27]|uniref:hypothetical protein n=1 Tax=Nonomuraea sp. MTCD27 TaxID=1676747 RepID=UPI0035BF37CB
MGEQRHSLPPTATYRTSNLPSEGQLNLNTDTSTGNNTRTPARSTATDLGSVILVAAKQEATWRERALNAEDALKAAHAKIVQQRGRIGELLGRIRDLEAEWTQDAIRRITTEYTTLKQRVRQLTTDNRTLDERLKAARATCGSRTVASPTLKRSSPTPARRPETRPRLASGCPTC